MGVELLVEIEERLWPSSETEATLSRSAVLAYFFHVEEGFFDLALPARHPLFHLALCFLLG